MKQQTLFAEDDITSEKTSSLTISKFRNKILSKEQTLFNKYSKKIETLRSQIGSEQLKYDTLLTYFIAKVRPQQEGYGNALVDFVKQLDRMLKYEKLTNIAREKVGQLIVNNLSRAFEYIIPNEEVKAIYDKYNDTSYDQEELEQSEMMKESIGDMFSKMFGVDIDFSDMKMDDESIARKMAEMKALFDNKEMGNNKKGKAKRKTKKEIDSEIKKKQVEELKNKNIRSIYTSLAKLLHPDLELDEAKKIEKTELMKKVINAYQEKDVHTLLKLEIEIIHKESENLEHLTDEKLIVLNSVLKEQMDELEQEKIGQQHHPKYESISAFMLFPEKRAIQNIDGHAQELSVQQNEIALDIEQLKGRRGVPFLTQILKTINWGGSFADDFDR